MSSLAAEIERLATDGAFDAFGETVTIGGVEHRAIHEPAGAGVPGTELARRSARVERLIFTGPPPYLTRGTIILLRGRRREVDGITVDGDLLTVTLA